MLPWRLPAACAVLVLAASPQPATITGRVFDTYHRPVTQATVATMERKFTDGQEHLVPVLKAIVDSAGMYRLSVAPGRYILAVLPPPNAMDHATVFPAYFQDTTDAAGAQPIDVGPGEIRPFTDFLLLEVESHRLSGRVTGLLKRGGAAGVALSLARGYTEVLFETLTDARGRFRFDHVPAGSYTLRALLAGGTKSASVHVDVVKPDVTDIQIHLRPGAR